MILVLSTYPDRESAEKAAEEIVRKELAACASVLRIECSYYRWKGKLEKKAEHLLIIKTMEKAYGQLETYIRDNHPHHMPEIIYLDVKGGQKDYLTWVESNSRLLSVPLDFKLTRRAGVPSSESTSARKPSTESR